MKQVELYSTPGCTYCLRIREYLLDKGVEFKEINVEEDESAKERIIAVSEHVTIPTVIVDNEAMIGFDQKRLDSLLGL